jgi:hypothetical protein
MEKKWCVHDRDEWTRFTLLDVKPKTSDAFISMLKLVYFYLERPLVDSISIFLLKN